jgi:hypothetical protein
MVVKQWTSSYMTISDLFYMKKKVINDVLFRNMIDSGRVIQYELYFFKGQD